MHKKFWIFTRIFKSYETTVVWFNNIKIDITLDMNFTKLAKKYKKLFDKKDMTYFLRIVTWLPA